MIQELSERKVALADLPALGPERDSKLVVDLGHGARLRLREEHRGQRCMRSVALARNQKWSTRERTEIDPGILVLGEVLDAEQHLDHLHRHQAMIVLMRVRRHGTARTRYPETALVEVAMAGMMRPAIFLVLRRSETSRPYCTLRRFAAAPKLA